MPSTTLRRVAVSAGAIAALLGGGLVTAPSAAADDGTSCARARVVFESDAGRGQEQLHIKDKRRDGRWVNVQIETSTSGANFFNSRGAGTWTHPRFNVREHRVIKFWVFTVKKLSSGEERYYYCGGFKDRA